MQTLFCQKHGEFPGPYPAACPTCLAQTGQTTVMCENHGLQVVKPGNSCSFCVMESVADQPLHRVRGQENAATISYFKPDVVKKKPGGRRAKL